MSTTEAVTSAIGALKDSPVLLFIILLNAGMVLAALFYLRTEQHQMDRMIELVAQCSQGLRESAPAVPR
jgi:hypothetical protein